VAYRLVCTVTYRLVCTVAYRLVCTVAYTVGYRLAYTRRSRWDCRGRTHDAYAEAVAGAVDGVHAGVHAEAVAGVHAGAIYPTSTIVNEPESGEDGDIEHLIHVRHEQLWMKQMGEISRTDDNVEDDGTPTERSILAKISYAVS
jgi:hypothetical protein